MASLCFAKNRRISSTSTSDSVFESATSNCTSTTTLVQESDQPEQVKVNVAQKSFLQLHRRLPEPPHNELPISPAERDRQLRILRERGRGRLLPPVPLETTIRRTWQTNDVSPTISQLPREELHGTRGRVWCFSLLYNPDLVNAVVKIRVDDDKIATRH